jgi:hypothetical protein
MSKYNHYSYCEMLATRLKPIGHTTNERRFFRATEQDSPEELATRISAAQGTILVAIDGADSSFSMPNSDLLVEKPAYSLLLLSQTESDNTDSIFAAQQSCRQIAKEIIAKMLEDALKYLNGLEFVDGNSFKVGGIGPVGDNFYGVNMSYTFIQGTPYSLTPGMWNDLYGINR